LYYIHLTFSCKSFNHLNNKTIKLAEKPNNFPNNPPAFIIVIPPNYNSNSPFQNQLLYSFLSSHSKFILKPIIRDLPIKISILFSESKVVLSNKNLKQKIFNYKLKLYRINKLKINKILKIII
jgi:hypothetical protein